MIDDKKKLEDQATDAILVKATKIETIDLEPTAAELDFFLSEEANDDSPVESVEALAEAEQRLSAMEAKEEYRALNRKNSGTKFSEETERMLAKKREELFQRMLSSRSQMANE
jgi:hypothetical protein